MQNLTLSPLNRGQWFSVLKNALIAGVSAGIVAWQASAYATDKTSLVAVATAGLTAILKVIEKLFSTS